MRRTFPKENKKKLNEVIKDLKALVRQQQKEIKFLNAELENLVKPIRIRKKQEPVIKLEPGSEEWRLDFLKRLKKEVFGE